MADEYEGLFNEGMEFFSENQYSKALVSYDKVLSINPGYTNAWFNRGNALSAMGLYLDAVASYDRAIEINPDIPGAEENRKNALQQENG